MPPASGRRYLVLGTDTDVGKTFVSATLCKMFIELGARVTACKPVETGAENESDLDVVRRLCRGSGLLRVAGGLRYALAAAPSAAARAEDLPAPSAREIGDIVRAAEADADAVVVETCGGALTPLSREDVVADIVPLLQDYAPLLIAGVRLGVLSHTIGVVEYVRSRGGRSPTVILNDRYAPSDASFVKSIREDLGARGIAAPAYVSYGASIDEVDLSTIVKADA